MKLQTKCSKHRQKEINPAGGVKVRNEQVTEAPLVDSKSLLNPST